MKKSDDAARPEIRLDKWLWCARLYRTRAEAADALSGGKVLAAGQRMKASRVAAPGMTLEIRSGALTREITLRALTPRRVSAAEAGALYTESAASIERRERHLEQVKTDRALHPRPAGRPTKRDRRRIIRFRRAVPGHSGDGS